MIPREDATANVSIVTISEAGSQKWLGASPSSDLLLVAQEVGQLIRRQVILPVAVRHHQQEDVASQGHHLVEDGELLVRQRALLIVRVGFL